MRVPGTMPEWVIVYWKDIAILTWQRDRNNDAGGVILLFA